MEDREDRNAEVVDHTGREEGGEGACEGLVGSQEVDNEQEQELQGEEHEQLLEEVQKW